MSKSFVDNLIPTELSVSLLSDIAEVVDNLASDQEKEGLDILLKLESDMEALIAMAEYDKDKLIFCNITNDRNFLK
jgi:hypothetical protein